MKNLPVDFALSPGMIATADIIIGERRPYECFLEPILDGASRVLTEANWPAQQLWAQPFLPKTVVFDWVALPYRCDLARKVAGFLDRYLAVRWR